MSLMSAGTRTVEKTNPCENNMIIFQLQIKFIKLYIQLTSIFFHEGALFNVFFLCFFFWISNDSDLVFLFLQVCFRI